MTPPVAPVEAPASILKDVRGTHAGMIVFLGIAAVNISNAAFHLISARYLGPADYSEVASLLALSGLITLPLGALQVLVARYIAGDAARGNEGAIAAVTRRTLAAAALVSLAITIALLALTPLIESLLSIGSPVPVVLTALLTLPALIAPIFFGLAQGLQRFGVLAAAMSAGSLARLAILGLLVVSGLSVDDALLATLIGGLASIALPLVPLRRWIRRIPTSEPVRSLGELTRSMVPIVAGTLAITSLTTADLIVAKLVLSDTDAGIYGSASLIGRTLLYVPATIVTVLLPKVSSRVAANRDTSEILGASLAVTAGISLTALLLLIVAPVTIVDASFGSRFDASSSLLGLFGVSMTAYALLNVLLIYHLGHGSARMSWLLIAGAMLQLAGYAFVHDSGRELIAVGIVVSIALLVAHETFVEPSLRHAVGWARGVVSRG